MAAYAALVSLLNNIHAIKKHPTLSTSLHNQPIQPLLEKIDFLLEFMEGNNYRGGSEEAQHLERQIAAAVHAVEDLIESHIVDLIEAKADLVCLLDLKQSIQDMDAVMEKAIEIKKKREVKEEKATHLAVARPLKEEGGSAMVGLDAELNHLLDELTGYQSSRRIISIVAMGGTGKTTLAKNVYENQLIKEHFQFRAWATISEQHNARQVLSQLLYNRGEMSNETVDDLGKQLYQTLFDRKYLIIMDDIWSVKAWDEVKRFFPDNKNASRILLTTRLSNVAKDCGSSLFMMNLLDEANSWKLFREKTFPNEDCPLELREVGEEIVKLCKGLALSIVVIGGLLLKSPKSVGYWKTVAKDLKSTLNSKEKQESLDVLSLSYHHLPPHLKPCFLYMGVFQEDSRIRVSEIVNLWVAEGFIKPIGSRVLEEIAEEYIKDLISRNLILVYRHQKNGKFEYCGIHDLLRDLCIKFAEQEEFFHLIQGGVRSTERRLAGDIRDVRWTEVNLPLTRSIIMMRGCITPSARHRLLRVTGEFDLESPTDYVNVNLRYVAYTKGYDIGKPTMWKLPPSVNRSWNLQTLIIRDDSRNSIILLPDFWNLRQLRHVKCYEMYIPDPPRSNREDVMLMLDNLHTLKTVVNLRFSDEVCKFIPNIKKLYLSYGQDHGYDDSLIECLCNLDRLQELELLKLIMYQDQSIFPNRELAKKLTSSFPRSLKKLSLKWYKLEWDDMTMIGSLPLLEVLQLFYINGGKRWSPVDEQFLQLKYLEIVDCDLVSWDTDTSHFPVLQKLYLEYLRNLEEIPLGIGDIPTLQLIRVACCNVSAAISAIRIKEDQLDNGGQLQVQLKMPSYEVEGFNQMLETEGLTISNIDFGIW